MQIDCTAMHRDFAMLGKQGENQREVMKKYTRSEISSTTSLFQIKTFFKKIKKSLPEQLT